MNPLLALKGPVRTNLSDESFVNPLRPKSRLLVHAMLMRARVSCLVTCVVRPCAWLVGPYAMESDVDDHFVPLSTATRVTRPVFTSAVYATDAEHKCDAFYAFWCFGPVRCPVRFAFYAFWTLWQPLRLCVYAF